MRKNVLIVAAAIALGTLFVPTCASSLDVDVGVSAGAWFPGDVRVHAPEGVGTTFDYTMTTETTIIGRAFIDLFALPWLGGGVYLNAAPVRFTSSQFLDNWDGEDHIMPADGITMLEVGGGLKARLRILEGLYLKPGVGAGFRMTLSDSPDARSYAVGVNGSLEIWYEMARNFSIFMDAGLLAQPFGGVPDVTLMDFGPLFYVGGGVGF
jgi:hypothetical protein